MRWRAVAVLVTLATTASAEPRLDTGARAGIALPLGAFDRSTRAGDTTFGGTPLALDAAWAFTPRVEAGALASFTPTTPRLCGSTSECLSSVGRDLELDALARFRGPAWRWITPEAELGVGWSWSLRKLVDGNATSTRRWSGPVLLRLAAIPTFRVGRSSRVGIVLAGSIARSGAFELSAPGAVRRGVDGAAFHGTFELGVRFGVDWLSGAAD